MNSALRLCLYFVAIFVFTAFVYRLGESTGYHEAKNDLQTLLDLRDAIMQGRARTPEQQQTVWTEATRAAIAREADWQRLWVWQRLENHPHVWQADAPPIHVTQNGQTRIIPIK